MASVDPYTATQKALHIHGSSFRIKTTVCQHSLDLSDFDRIFLFGVGKAAAPMAKAVEDKLSGRFHNGHIIVKYDHSLTLQNSSYTEAGHPIPDEEGLFGTQEILRLIKGVRPTDLVIFLISGGGSSLFIQPKPGISLSGYAE